MPHPHTWRSSQIPSTSLSHTSSANRGGRTCLHKVMERPSRPGSRCSKVLLHRWFSVSDINHASETLKSSFFPPCFAEQNMKNMKKNMENMVRKSHEGFLFKSFTSLSYSLFSGCSLFFIVSAWHFLPSALAFFLMQLQTHKSRTSFPALKAPGHHL